MPLDYEKALARMLDAVSPTSAEACAVRESLGRILAADLAVPWDMPDLPRSAVDGFAFSGSSDAPRKIVAEVRAGILPGSVLAAGETAAIMTGAVVPEGADRVAMVEDCRVEGDRMHPPTGTSARDFINPVGSEAQAGSTFAWAGRRIGPTVFPSLFCAGVTEVQAHRPVRLGLIVSGDEVREIEDGPAPGQVFNTNRYILEAACAGLGVDMIRTASVDDDEARTRALLDELRSECDIVVTSGGISKGRYDHLGAILRGDGYDLLIRGTAIKPGRPLHVARAPDGCLVMAMPGYPGALLTNTFLYLVPVLKKMGGRGDFQTRWFPVTLADPQRGRPGKVYLNRVRLEHRHERWTAHDPGSQLSSHFLVFARCDGMVRLPLSLPDHSDLGSFTLAPGTVVPALHFSGELL